MNIKSFLTDNTGNKESYISNDGFL